MAIPSLSCTYKALISATKGTTKSTMSIYLTSAPLGTFPASSTKPTLFFSRPPPLNNFLACAAGSPAPQAEKFSLSVHLWVKLQATKLTFRMPWSRTCLPDQGLTGLVSASLRHFLTVRHSSSTKIFILPPCSSHSALIWCLGTHIPQLVGAWWLLGRFAGQKASRCLAEITFSTFTNTILKTKIL